MRQLGEAQTFLFPGGLSKGASVVMQHIFVETEDAFLGCVIDYREQRLGK
jgi:hypothetical protein